MIYVVFAENNEGCEVEFSTEHIERAIEKFQEDEELYFIEICDEEYEVVGQLSSINEEGRYYLELEDDEIYFDNIEEAVDYIKSL